MHIPKVDTHRHLGGSISPSFVWEVIRDHNWYYLAETYDEVAQAMTFAPGEPRNFHRFLNKFTILDKVKWTEDLIDRSVKQVAGDLVREGIDYTFMDFSINKYMDAGIGWHRYQAINFIHGCFEAHAPGRIGLMISLKYEAARAGQRQLAKLIGDPTVAECVIGIDLVGDEGYFDSKFYAPIMRDWRRAGKIVRAHVGESQHAENIRAAIEMGCNHIAHGFKIWEYPDIVKLALDNNVCFDLALSSNYVTGTWSDRDWHPIRAMVDAGLYCTIGTDDPIQCANGNGYLTLEEEFELLRSLGFTRQESDAIALNALTRAADLGVPQFRAFLERAA